jgi:hypothetical protein
MDIIKITPDREKAKSILKMTSLLKERIKAQDKKKVAALIIADYYEIVKEMITSVLLLDGKKTLSHKDLIEYIKTYKEFNSGEIAVMDNLRILRNRIAYEGFFIDPSYLDRNEASFELLIAKLEKVIKKKLE